MPKKRRAYAVFGGGGMRGAALAGALKAAQELDFDFIGYGGVSAGSVIALLAAAGYTGDELTSLLTAEDSGLAKLLDDKGDDLYAIARAFERFQRARHSAGKVASAGRFYWSHRKLIHRMLFDYGLYTGDSAIDYLKQLIITKLPDLAGDDAISFKALRQAVYLKTGKQISLKVLATDLVSGRGLVFPNDKVPDTDPVNASVLQAVRASIGYPLVFQPKELGGRLLVDGGVSSGLPVYLFEPEFQQTKIPIIAFELGDNARARNTASYTFFDYAGDLLDATINASDETERITTEGIYSVRLRIRRELGLHFKASPPTLARMAKDGYEQADERLKEIKNQEPWAEERRTRLAGHVEQLLGSLVHHIEDKTALKHCRAYVMLCTVDGKRKVRYSCRMRHDPDRHMVIGLEDGPSGLACIRTKVMYTDLESFRQKGLPSAELPPESQIGIITAPLLQYWGTRGVVAGSELHLLGTISVDFTADPRGTDSALDVAADEAADGASRIIVQWADIISMLLKYESLTDGGS